MYVFIVSDIDLFNHADSGENVLTSKKTMAETPAEALQRVTNDPELGECDLEEVNEYTWLLCEDELFYIIHQITS